MLVRYKNRIKITIGYRVKESKMLAGMFKVRPETRYLSRTFITKEEYVQKLGGLPAYAKKWISRYVSDDLEPVLIGVLADPLYGLRYKMKDNGSVADPSGVGVIEVDDFNPDDDHGDWEMIGDLELI